MAQRNKVPSVGIPAGNKRQAAVDITASVQARLRSAINGLGIGDVAVKPDVGAATRELTLAELEGTISDVHLDLCRQGFVREYAERALEALPPHSIHIEAALDWLLFNLDRDQLPEQFATQVQTTVPIELRHKAKEAQPAAHPNAVSESEAAETQRRAAAAALAAEEIAATAKREKMEAEEREKEARRAWILQYAAGSSSEEDESQRSDSAEGSVIEDWEVWGDPREVERRRAERHRNTLPREDRLLLIAEELAAAKERAALAKATGDKAGQRSVGQIIGQLKRELAELGAEEADLPLVGTSKIVGNGGINEGNVDEHAKGEDEGINRSTASDVEQDGDDAISNASSDEGADLLGFDLFGDGADVDDLEQVPGDAKRKAALAKARAAAAILQPWGISDGGKKKGSGKGKEPKSKAPEAQLPRSLLQQACQRLGWGAPRYERLPPGGERDPSGAGCRYSVSIDIGKSSGPRKKVGKNTPSGAQNFIIPDADDGWERIEEAQNAVAAFALLSLCGEEDPDAWQRMAPPYNELWLVWQASGTAAPQQESEQDTSARLEFVRSLAVKKLEEARNQATVQGTSGAGLFRDSSSWEETLTRSLQKHMATHNSDVSRAVSERMLGRLKEWRESEEGVRWQAARDKLPAAALRERLKEALERHDVVVVSGETGSGKTTQVPQFLLESATEGGIGGITSVVCTQPRRIAAISVAERVANERGEPPPGQKGSVVGYAVRLDSAMTSETRLLFCTTGVLLRRLTNDAALSSVSHVVVDEVHERTMQGDFLMALLKELVVRRRAAGLPLKVILMSATLDSAQMADYFGGCPVLHAPGRTFPVEQFYLEDVYETTGYIMAPDAPAALRLGAAWRDRQRRLEGTAGMRNKAAVRSGWGDDEADGPPLNPNYDEQLYEGYSVSACRNLARVDEERIDFDLLEDLIHYVHEGQDEGAILVFLPGMAEISALQRRLEAVGSLRGHWIIPLHSTVAPADQRKAFKRPPKGTRKIVIATNIAETSVTVEDVRFVIDSGRHKERRYDPSRSMSLLVEDWTSSASAKQRRGRAGRTQEGVCYALYTRNRFESKMKKFQTPEMLRVPLEELVLQVHLLRLGQHAEEFTAKLLQPPPKNAVEGALRTLRDVGALAEDEALTPLGYHLAQLPVDVRVGKLLLLGAFLGCLSPALSIAACLSHKSPFAGGSLQDGADRARAALAAPESGTLASGQQSDHLVMAAALQGWLEARKRGGAKAAGEYAHKNCLGQQTLDMLGDMRAQFAGMLANIGFTGNAGKGEGQPQRGTQAWFDDPLNDVNKHASYPAVVKAVLLAALHPNLAVMDGAGGGSSARPTWHDGVGPVAIHPSSICASLIASAFQRPFVTYLEKVRTSQVFLRDCTVVPPAAVLLFGGDLRVDHAAGRAIVGGWVHLKVTGSTAALIHRLRWALQELLARRVAAPLGRRETNEDACGAEVVKAIVELLNHEEAAHSWNK